MTHRMHDRGGNGVEGCTFFTRGYAAIFFGEKFRKIRRVWRMVWMQVNSAPYEYGFVVLVVFWLRSGLDFCKYRILNLSPL